MLASYIAAADQELPRLSMAIDWARREGYTPEQIAFGEEKLRRLREARELARQDLAGLTASPARP